MSRPEAILNDVKMLNNRFWEQIGPLENKLLELEKAYQASLRPAFSINDVLNRADPGFFFNRMKQVQEMNDLAAKINALYLEWERNLTFIKLPPAAAGPSGSLASKIPWPSSVPMSVRKRLGRIIEQGGIPISKRVQIIPSRAPYGGQGVAVEFAKW